MSPTPREPAPAWAHAEIGRLRTALAQANARIEELLQQIDRNEIAWSNALDQLGGSRCPTTSSSTT